MSTADEEVDFGGAEVAGVDGDEFGAGSGQWAVGSGQLAVSRLKG